MSWFISFLLLLFLLVFWIRTNLDQPPPPPLPLSWHLMNITCREEVTGQLTDPGDSMTLRVSVLWKLQVASGKKRKNTKNESKVEGKAKLLLLGGCLNILLLTVPASLFRVCADSAATAIFVVVAVSPSSGSSIYHVQCRLAVYSGWNCKKNNNWNVTRNIAWLCAMPPSMATDLDGKKEQMKKVLVPRTTQSFFTPSPIPYSFTFCVLYQRDVHETKHSELGECSLSQSLSQGWWINIVCTDRFP